MITIIDSCGNNFASLTFALQRLGVNVEQTSCADKIKKADYLILPGVGSAHAAMSNLQQRGLIDIIKNRTQPTLGICLGMQLLFEFSEEGNTDCLGILPGRITRFTEKKQAIVPHMGWNKLKKIANSKVLTETQTYQYFIHSYFAPVNQHTIATTHYGENFSAFVEKDNFFGAQFHPEKSGSAGLNLLENFIKNSVTRA